MADTLLGTGTEWFLPSEAYIQWCMQTFLQELPTVEVKLQSRQEPKREMLVPMKACDREM